LFIFYGHFVVSLAKCGRHLLSVHERKCHELSKVDIEDHDLVQYEPVPHVDAVPEAEQEIELEALVPLVFASQLKQEFLSSLCLSSEDATQGGWLILLPDLRCEDALVNTESRRHVDVCWNRDEIQLFLWCSDHVLVLTFLENVRIVSDLIEHFELFCRVFCVLDHIFKLNFRLLLRQMLLRRLAMELIHVTLLVLEVT